MGCCLVKDEQFSITFTPKNAIQQNRTQQLNNSKMLTFKAKKGDDLQLNIFNDENQTNSHITDNIQALENLEQIERQISPINNKRFTFSNGFGLTNHNKGSNIELAIDKRIEKSSYNEKPSQLLTQALKDYNLNSIEFSRFQDFILSSQNNNSLHFDINNINCIINAEEDKEYSDKSNINKPQEEVSAYKKKVISSNNNKKFNKRFGNIPSPIKENQEFPTGCEDFNLCLETAKFEENKESNKIELINKYKHVFGDVEHNTSRSGRSYYESHHKSARKADVEGDFTNLKNNNSIMSTEKTIKNGVANEDEQTRKRYHSTHLKNVIQNVNNQKENNKAYNFNSNLFLEEQKLRSSKEVSNMVKNIESQQIENKNFENKYFY